MPSGVTRFEFDALAARVSALESRATADESRLTADESRLALLETASVDYASRIAALEATVSPPPPAGRVLLGGWRLVQEFARGGLAIDFATMRCWITGHSQRPEVVEYQLPAMGAGADLAAWPAVTGAVSQGWWDQALYSNGLCYWQGVPWAAPKSPYDTAPPATTLLVAQDGRTITVNLPRQKFAGFVKRGPGQEPYAGCGGYESGQGSCSGPTFGTLAGEARLTWGWPLDPNTGWSGREEREPNYFPEGHVDSWVAWEPRNGQGRWACDRIYGGGLVLPEGVCFWPWMGTGELKYSLQSETFAPPELNRTYRYRYDEATGARLGREEIDQPKVSGQELDAQGRVYLCKTNVWQSGSYQVDPAIFVYG